jgi:RNA processing factor Prp31/fibrillarin-like rRNA methylase
VKALETRKKFLEKAKKQTQEALSRKDALIIQAVRSLDDFDEVKSLLQQRVAEWFKINFPDLRANDDVLSKIAAEFGSKEHFTEKKLAEILSEEKAKAIMRVKGESFGAEFDDSDAKALQTLGRQVMELTDARKTTEEYITELAGKEMKNVVFLTDAILAARILALAGSLENLAEMPASTVQVIGAEKSLFKHLRQHSNPPKHGIIFQHPAINSAPLEQRGRIARALATKIAIAAKADYYTGNFIAPKLKEIFEKRVEQIQASNKKPYKSTAPKPFEREFGPRKSFGGERRRPGGFGGDRRGGQGVFVDGKKFYTRSIAKGFKVHGETLKQEKGIEYREWNPYQSKLCAAIAKGLKTMPISQGKNVLYLGAAHGATPSFVSDIVGKKGMVYCIEIGHIAMRDLIRVCEQRENMIPILADARKPEAYEEAGKIDVVFEDVADPQQAEILLQNARFLGKSGIAMIAVKARAVNSTEDPEKVYARIKKILSASFEIVEERDLRPFEKDHLFLVLKKK